MVSLNNLDNIRGSRGGGGGGGQGSGHPSLKNNKNIGLLSNTGLDRLKNHKATKPSSARQQNAILGVLLAGHLKVVSYQLK